MFPYRRGNSSTHIGSNNRSSNSAANPISDEKNPIFPYFSRFFATPTAKSNDSSYFIPKSSHLSPCGSTYREISPSIFNFCSPLRRHIHSPSQPSPSRPRTATEFLRNTTSSIIDRAIQKLEYNKRKRPSESLVNDIDDDNPPISNHLSLKRCRGFEEDSINQNFINHLIVETPLPRPKLKPASSATLSRPSSTKLPPQVSRLSSAALEAIAFATTKRQRPPDSLGDESILIDESNNTDDISEIPPAAKRRATRDSETQTAFQVDSATSTRESYAPDKLPKRRPPNMTSVSQLFTRLEAKARATSSGLRMAALRRMGGGLSSFSMEDRQARIRRIFEEIADKDGLKFENGPASNSLPSSADTRSSSLTTSAISPQPSQTVDLEPRPKSPESLSGTTTTISVIAATAVPSGETTVSEIPSINSTVPSSFARTSLPELSPVVLSTASTLVSTSTCHTVPTFSFGKVSTVGIIPVSSSEISTSKSVPSFTFGKATSDEQKTMSTATTTTNTTSGFTIPPNITVSSSEINLPSCSTSVDSNVSVLKRTNGPTDSGTPKFSFSFGGTNSTSAKTSSPAASGFNFSIAKTTSYGHESSTKPLASTGFAFFIAPTSDAVIATSTSSTETPTFNFSLTSTTNNNTAVIPCSSSPVPAFKFTQNSISSSSVLPGIGFSASPNPRPSLSLSAASTDSPKTSAPISAASAAPLFSFPGKPTTGPTITSSGGFNFSGNLNTTTNNPSIGVSPAAFNFPSIASSKLTTTVATSPTTAFNFSATLTASTSPFSLPKTAGATVPPPAVNFSLKSTTSTSTATQSVLTGFGCSANSTMTSTTSASSLFGFPRSTSSASSTTAFGLSGFNFSNAKATSTSSNLAEIKTVSSLGFPSAITSATTTTIASSVFTFSASQPSKTSAGGFSFTTTSATSSSPFGSFSASTQNSSSNKNSPAFSFGSTTHASPPFSFNTTGHLNGTYSVAGPFGTTQNSVTTTISNPLALAGTNPATTVTTTASGFSFSASPSLFKFGASGQNTPTASATTQSGFSLNLPTIKSSPSMFSTGDATKRPGDSSFSTTNDSSITPAKFGFGGFSGANQTNPFNATPSFNFGGNGSINPTGGFNFNATNAVGGFNFGASASNPPIFGASGQASPNPFNAQPTTPNAAASFAQRRRQMRATRRR